MSTIIDQATHVLDMDEHTNHADPVPAGSLSASMAKLPPPITNAVPAAGECCGMETSPSK